MSPSTVKSFMSSSIFSSPTLTRWYFTEYFSTVPCVNSGGTGFQVTLSVVGESLLIALISTGGRLGTREGRQTDISSTNLFLVKIHFRMTYQYVDWRYESRTYCYELRSPTARLTKPAYLFQFLWSWSCLSWFARSMLSNDNLLTLIQRSCAFIAEVAFCSGSTISRICGWQPFSWTDRIVYVRIWKIALNTWDWTFGQHLV